MMTPGCGNQTDSSKPDAKAHNAATSQEAGVGGKAQDARREIAVDLGHGVKLQMVLIPAGEFLMGAPDADQDSGDWERKPQHRVRITKPFFLGKYLVTQEQWETVMGSNPSRFKGPKNPVEMVYWRDCQAFLSKLNTKAGGKAGKFSLPTEAQWEHACRAGSTTQYSFGDDPSGLGQYAWYEENSGGRTHPVGEKKPNAWGLYDMHGNVWEWCQDWFDGGYYARSPADDPRGAAHGQLRVLRGGGWINPAWHCRSAHRGNLSPSLDNEILGFRVCLVPADGADHVRVGEQKETIAEKLGSEPSRRGNESRKPERNRSHTSEDSR